METKAASPQINSRSATMLMAGMAAFLLCSVPARADLLAISIQSPISVNAGTSGNGFDVLLTNLSGPAVSIAAFTFEISTTTDITFTATNTATVLDPYIFSGNSLFGPIITVANTGQDLSASDLYSVPASSVTLGTGATAGLGRILFDVSSTAPSETVDVTLAAYPATSLSDDLLNNVPVARLNGGQINISAITSTVPEPSSLILLLTAVPLVWRGRRLRR
jgi:hypothetical protein